MSSKIGFGANERGFGVAVGPVNRDVFGGDFENVTSQAPETIALATGMPLARFPGGDADSAFYWTDGPYTDGIYPSFDWNTFANLMRQNRVRVFLEANVVRGTARPTVSAMAWSRLGDVTAAQFRGIAAIARDLDAEVRITNRQNFVLRGLREDQLPDLHARLVALDMAKPGSGGSKPKRELSAYEQTVEGEIDRLAKEAGQRAGIKAGVGKQGREKSYAAAKQAEVVIARVDSTMPPIIRLRPALFHR